MESGVVYWILKNTMEMFLKGIGENFTEGKCRQEWKPSYSFRIQTDILIRN